MKYDKITERRILLDSFFSSYDENKKFTSILEKYTGKKYNDLNEAIEKVTDEDLINVFNKYKPKRILANFDGDTFEGKYYIYNGEFRLNENYDIKKYISIIKTLNSEEYNLLKSIINVFIKKFNINYIPVWLKYLEIKNEYLRNTGNDISGNSKHWKKLISLGIIEKRKKGNIVVKPELIMQLHEAINEYEKAITTEKKDIFYEDFTVPENLFDSIIDEINGKEINQLKKLKNVLRHAIKSHIEDAKRGIIRPRAIILVGNAATAKTMFLLDINSKLKSTKFIAADQSAGKAGLIDEIIETKPLFLLIDEIQLLDVKSLSILLSILGSGKAQITTKTTRKSADLHVMLIATTHPENVEFIKEKTKGKLAGLFGNVNDEPRVIMYELESYDDETLKVLMKNVLIKLENAPEEVAEYIVNELIKRNIKGIRIAINTYRIVSGIKDIEECKSVIRDHLDLLYNE